VLDRLRVMGIKFEATPGTAESLADADGAFYVLNPKIVQDAKEDHREKEGSLGEWPLVTGAPTGTATFSMEMFGGAANPAWALACLAGCGMGYNGSKFILTALAPDAVGSTSKSLTIGLYQNGRVLKIYGAMGNAVFHFVSGERVVVDYTFKGKWAAPADATILAPTWTTATPLKWANSSLSLGGYAPKIAKLDLDLQNEVYLRPDANHADLSGIAHAMITKRLPQIKMDPEAVLIATKDLYAEWKAGTETGSAVTWVARAGADDATFSGTKGMWVGPNPGERSGLLTDEVTMQLNADDLEITFT